MRKINKITFWENKRRLELLLKFRDDVVEYYDNVSHALIGGVTENDVARNKRKEINMQLDEIEGIVIASDISPVLYHSPAPAIGGFAGYVDLIQNLFRLYNFDCSPQELLDFIDRSISKYQKNAAKSLVRTFNPFFWIGFLLDAIVSIPFIILGRIGFNQSKMETSKTGKIIKGILYVITVIAAFLTILDKLGYLSAFNQKWRELIL